MEPNEYFGFRTDQATQPFQFRIGDAHIEASVFLPPPPRYRSLDFDHGNYVVWGTFIHTIHPIPINNTSNEKRAVTSVAYPVTSVGNPVIRVASRRFPFQPIEQAHDPLPHHGSARVRIAAGPADAFRFRSYLETVEHVTACLRHAEPEPGYVFVEAIRIASCTGAHTESPASVA